MKISEIGSVIKRQFADFMEFDNEELKQSTKKYQHSTNCIKASILTHVYKYLISQKSIKIA